MRRISYRLLLSAIGLSVGFILIVFVFSHSNGNDAATENKPRQSAECNCPEISKNKQNVASSSLLIQTSLPNKTATCTEVKNTSAVQRAIVIFYPHHQRDYFFPEVRW